MPKIMYKDQNYSMGNGGEVDSILSLTSENPVQNKIVTEALSNKLDIDDISDWAKSENKPTYTASEIGADAQGSADTALSSAKNYTDTKIANLVNSAPETLDTLGEIAEVLADNKDVIEALDTTVGKKANASDLTTHMENKNNPHGVTKSQIGLGNVPNVATNDQTPTYTDTTTFSTLTSGEKLSAAFAKIKLAISNLISHISNTSNPHSVTKSQVGLGNVENKTSATIRSELTKSDVTTALGYTPPTTNTTYTAATEVPKVAGIAAVGTSAKYAREDHVHPPQTSVSGNAGTATNLLANIMPSNANFNDYTTPGFYYCNANVTVKTMSNKPTENAFFMIVGKHAGTSQTVFEYMASGFKIYHRNLYSGTWGSWIRLYTTTDKPTASDVGAAAASHTHNYAGSSSAGGAATSAIKATQDSAGQQIDSTYIKSLSVSGKTITYTKGDGNTGTITTQDTNTTYSNFKGATASVAGGAGLVPAPAAGNQAKFLRADGTWQTPTNTTYSAVTSSANGLATPSLLSTANGALQKTGGTMTGALVAQSNTNYTTAQVRNITMSTSAPSGGSNGQIHFQYN